MGHLGKRTMYFLDMVRHCPAIIIPDPSRAVWKPAAKLTKKLQNANKKPKNIAKKSPTAPATQKLATRPRPRRPPQKRAYRPHRATTY